MKFPCPQCVTWFKAPSAIAGTRCRCPRCQYVFVAPQHSRLPPSGETYALHQGANPLPTKTSTSIPITCSTCQTRMFGDPDQVGQTLICPDCGAPAVVPPAATVKKPTAHPPGNDIYPLCEEVQPASGNPPIEEPTLIRVMCPRCNTILYATEDQIGRSLTCPDCTTSVVVPQPPLQRPTIDVMAGAGVGYALADQPQASAVSKPPPPPPVIHKPPAAVQSRRHFEPYFRRPILPRWPFFVGTFSFPFSSDARAYALLMAIWAATSSWMASQSVLLANDTDGRSMFLGAMFSALTLISTVMLFAFAAASALAVTRDTAGGCDKISDWPGMLFVDWIGDPFYVFNAFCASLAPGVALAWVLGRFDQPGEAAIPACLFLLFPFILLSTLETSSPLGLFSWPALQSLWQAWRGWAAFYLTTAGLLGVTGFFLNEAFSVDILWKFPVAAPILTVVWFIYFRLVGRLALYCAVLTRKRAEHDPTE